MLLYPVGVQALDWLTVIIMDTDASSEHFSNRWMLYLMFAAGLQQVLLAQGLVSVLACAGDDVRYAFTGAHVHQRTLSHRSGLAAAAPALHKPAYLSNSSMHSSQAATVRSTGSWS